MLSTLRTSSLRLAGAAGHRAVQTYLIAAAVAVAAFILIALLLGLRPVIAPAMGTVNEAHSLVEFRAAERDDWSAGTTTEAQSLIEFRADERTGR